jgi:ABC-type transport system involved in multi-copper enzyme maturation permease subunit
LNVLPVITRELRAESRHAITYWSRLIGALVAAFLLVVLIYENSWGRRGDHIFMILHGSIYVTIWLTVPILTADCLARERREGTLGLLFLTPLRAHEIVLGKSFVHMLRGLTLVLAVWPMLTIPLLIGGVSWLDVCSASGFQLSAVLICLAAGMLASSFGKQWTRTLLLAFLFTAFLFLVYAFLLTLLWIGLGGIPSRQFRWQTGGVVGLIAGSTRGWSKMLVTPGKAQAWLWLVGASVSMGIVCLLASLLAAGSRLRKSWQDESPARRQLWWFRTFCTPQFLRGVLHRKMGRALERNPIGWLQQYSWSARLSKWGWCLAVVIAECWVLVQGSYSDFNVAQIFIGCALIAGLALIAAGSFRTERENGALELLLVTPLRERQIVFGRLRGVFAQMLPALCICLVSVLGTVGMYRGNPPPGIYAFVASAILVVPIIGLAVSLRLRSFLGAWLLTVALGFLIPYFSIGLSYFILRKMGIRHLNDFNVAVNYMIALQWCAFFICGGMLFRNLKQRIFALNAG